MKLGIEIGGTKLQFVLWDRAGKICESRKLSVDPTRGAAGIRHQIEGALPKLLSGRRIARTGVGFGGPVDWKTGRICRSHQIEGWSEFDLGGWLRHLVGAPVVVDNDANVAALGEARARGRRGFQPGLLRHARQRRRWRPGGGRQDLSRREAWGSGDWPRAAGPAGDDVESRCSGWAVDARIRELKVKEPKSLLAGLIGEKVGGEAKHLAAAWQQGDAAAKRLLQETAEDLAFGLSHVVHLFHPEDHRPRRGIVRGGRAAARVRRERPAAIHDGSFRSRAKNRLGRARRRRRARPGRWNWRGRRLEALTGQVVLARGRCYSIASHPTTNIQHRTSNACAHWQSLDVRCWMLVVGCSA